MQTGIHSNKEVKVNPDRSPFQKDYFVQFVKRFALRTGDFLERKVQDTSAKFSVYSLFAKNHFSSTLYSLPLILLLWAALIALSPNSFLFDPRLWDTSSASLDARFARFSVLSRRDGSAGKDQNISGEVGLSMEGCFLQPAVSRRSGNQIINEYREPVAFNGWFLRNGYGLPESDMALVMLETSMNGQEYKRIAVSKPYCSLMSDGSEREYQGIAMPRERGGEIIFDFATAWCTTPLLLSCVARLVEAFFLLLGFLFVWYGSSLLMPVTVSMSMMLTSNETEVTDFEHWIWNRFGVVALLSNNPSN
eukprot:195145-Hanusia_phi.AAC.1